MGEYDVQQVCLRGHQITDVFRRHPEQRNESCPDCGAETIWRCRECDEPIAGHHFIPRVSTAKAPVPTHCDACGVPFPWASDVDGEPEDVEPTPDRLRRMLRRFHATVLQLHRRHDQRATLEVSDEHDVRDLLHALLVLEFSDVRPEPWQPMNGNASERVDLLLEKEKVVVAVKRTASELSDQEILSQLAEDVSHYQNRVECQHLVWFVYDPERRVGNPSGLARGVIPDPGLDLEVIVSPPVA